MIYAIIIIAALAAAFVILIRRLPEAANQNPDLAQPRQPQEPKPAIDKKGFSFSMPKIELPKVKLPEAKPKVEKSIEPTSPAASVTPVVSPTPASAPTATKPKFQFPSWSNARTNQPSQSTEQKTNKSAKDDFWEGLDEEPAVATPTAKTVEAKPEKATPVAAPKPVTPVAPAPVTPVPTPKPAPSLFTPFKDREKAKPKDTFQEAEDLFAIKDYPKAEKLYLKLATSDPKNPKIYSRLGVIYMEQSNFEDARDALQQAIKLEPNVASRHFNLALAYANLGSAAKAIASMEAALKYDPSNRKYRKMLDELLSSR